MFIRHGSISSAILVVTLACGAVTILWLAISRNGPMVAKEPERAIDSNRQDNDFFAVTIRRPPGPPRVDTGLKDVHGNVLTVSCSTCHATRKPNPDNKQAEDLDEFHGQLQIAHGSVTCLSCHNPDDYDSLRLADGKRIEFSDVMTMCAQCHGTQMRDFNHGAHGGMNGYWDLTRGPRTRNNCVDCHDPHLPKFPAMQPTFKPRDRFLIPPDEKGDRAHE